MVQAAYDFLLHHMPVAAQQEMKLQNTFDSVQEACVRMYTSSWTYGIDQPSAKKMHAYINHAIFHDNMDQLRRFMPVIRIINSYLCEDKGKQHTTPGIVYRGTKLRNSVILKFVKDEECRFATYLSTSYSMNVAAGYASDPCPMFVNESSTSTVPDTLCQVILKIHLPEHKHAPHFRSVKDIANYIFEDEVLFVPYSKFKVVAPAVQMNATCILIELLAIDNWNPDIPKVNCPTQYLPSPVTPTTPSKKTAPKTHNYF